MPYLRRDKRDDVEAGDDPGTFADESEDFDGVHTTGAGVNSAPRPCGAAKLSAID